MRAELPLSIPERSTCSPLAVDCKASRTKRISGLVIAFGVLTAATIAHAQDMLPVQNSVYHDISTPLGKIKAEVNQTKGKRLENFVHLLTIVETKGPQKDPLVQLTAVAALPVLAETSEGLGQGLKYDSNVTPSDATGAVGTNYFVEWVNDAVLVINKNTHEPVYGPADGRTIWANFAPKDNPAHACAETNDGDPIVLYDHIENRWFLSQFSHKGGPPYLQCIAVSRSSDPLGTYARYAYQFADFNDYGKFAIWPDGYYAGFNMYESTAKDSPGKGGQSCAFDRISMLAGKEARMVCFRLPQAGLLPSDLDGQALPSNGAPNYFLSLGPSRLRYWKFHVDWSHPEHSTMSGPDDVSLVSSFVSACTVMTCELIPQKGSDGTLDTMGDRLMYRLAYRKFKDHESLVVNHAVRVPGRENSNIGVIAFRWYEIRPSANGLAVYQSGTFRPSTISRWMGSMAMDKAGNIAIGYNASSSTDYPSIYYTGRIASQPDPNTLGQEYLLQSGSGSQSGHSWGDYTTMSVDPTDDCTFWFVSQYLKKGDANLWHTTISRLRFQSCK